MTSVSSPLPESSEQESTTEPIKLKRLPRSAKKRLRYERLRERQKQAPKKKKKRISSTHPPSITIPSGSAEITNDPTPSVTGKLFKRIANERLAEINRESKAPIICIDCAYNDSMSEKEIASLARQIGRCYSSNRRATNPVRLILTNWIDDSPLARECRRVNNGFENYQIIRSVKPIYEAYPAEQLIYLSPNGEQVLTDVNENHIHVIGGLVDESVRKNTTYQVCQDKSIACYKLPIQTYMKHSIDGGTFNQILSINQVFDILLTYMTEKHWGEALKRNVPERKGWVTKTIADQDQLETV